MWTETTRYETLPASSCFPPASRVVTLFYTVMPVFSKIIPTRYSANLVRGRPNCNSLAIISRCGLPAL
jgi:hypothetical protein